MDANVQTSSPTAQSACSPRSRFEHLGSLWRAEFLSPKDLVRRAVVIALVYGVVSACGLRDFTSILNGTVGSLALGWHVSAFLGLLYIIVYLAFVLLAPMLVLAAAILLLWKKIVK